MRTIAQSITAGLDGDSYERLVDACEDECVEKHVVYEFSDGSTIVLPVSGGTAQDVQEI
jgi:hypothetical protein